MTSQFIFVMKKLSKAVGNKILIQDTWLSFLYGAKIGIIGSNGAGKSTLMKIIAGLDKEFEGEAWPDKNVKIGYLPQEPQLDSSKTVLENVMMGLKEKTELLKQFDQISQKFSNASPEEIESLLEQQTLLQEQIDAVNGWNLEHEVSVAMNALSCPEKNKDTTILSGGEKRRVALCKLLLQKPDMLLLDEPTNHLDAQSVAWLEHYLKEYTGTVILVTHDRYFLDNIAHWILEIDNKKCVPWESNYSSWLEKKYNNLGMEKQRQKDLAKQIKRELQWITEGKHTKNKARVKAYDQLLAQKQTISDTTSQIFIPNGPKLGKVAIRVNDISKSFQNDILFQNFSCTIPSNAVVGIIGPNGAGKSTFLNLITGTEVSDTGEIEIEKSVSIGFVNQLRDNIQDENTVWEEISEQLEEIQLGDRKIKTRAYCSMFNFKGDVQQKKVKDLSGGERNRLHMAKLLKKEANVILLDEPSNDLDIETLRSLETAIEQFTGTMLVVSHDRWFLDRVATHIMDFDKEEKQIRWFEGNYTEYKTYLDKIGKDVSISKKSIYKKLH
ncbi:energy-dependent translational throttle protein EttA [Candidatus Sneabacter namystus]|uniref:Energy-dependent translational throttle protein EttA n=1 Tax=Candidatus Sneabacter namystus TaxID=2601646 RepID=A0A5C0UI21_9RICK|nr:energy-dependent translational throttle protein EttA [Candidatus Sneabacter namystus]QEK39390.1 energy-dependent translational throttle protein EttA [Candidatus Sneabacter namystus]